MKNARNTEQESNYLYTILIARVTLSFSRKEREKVLDTELKWELERNQTLKNEILCMENQIVKYKNFISTEM